MQGESLSMLVQGQGMHAFFLDDLEASSNKNCSAIWHGEQSVSTEDLVAAWAKHLSSQLSHGLSSFATQKQAKPAGEQKFRDVNCRLVLLACIEEQASQA